MIARCPIKNRSDDRKSFPLINFGLRLVGSAGLLILLTLGATSQISTPPLKPPPPELFFEGQMSQNLSAGPYGEASFELDWKAKRIDFRWDEVKKDYEDFYDWFTTRKDELENRFAAAQGRGKISAARELFEFALEAEEKKKQLDSNRVYSGKWEGEGEEITVVSKLGTFRIHLKISFATFPVNATALYPDYLISGESPSGKYTVRVDTFFDVNQRVHLDESFDFRATLSGKYRSRENLILLDVLPKDITGMTKAQMTAERLGTLRTVATYRKGTLHQRSSWPSMEAFLAYCKIITGDMSPPPELEATKPVPEEEILETFQLDGRLNWTPDDIPDLKHDYFRLWFDIFWGILFEEISQAPDSKQKAEIAQELYQRHVKKACADAQVYAIRGDVVDHCRLWPGRAGSSLDESFETYFRWMDIWHQEQVNKASSSLTKREKARNKFAFSTECTINFELGYLSEELRDELRLWMGREKSYIDNCFQQFFDYHNQYWEEEIAQASGFEGKDAAAAGYFGEVPTILEYGLLGFLSEQLISSLGLVAGLPRGYGDRVFRRGWSQGLNYFEPQLPAPGEKSPVVEAFLTWLLQELGRTQLGVVSPMVEAEVEARWQKLLADYPYLSLRLDQ